MPEILPLVKPGDNRTFTAGAAITGGQVVYVSGARTVTPTAGANAAWIGVALHDAASGDKVTVGGPAVYQLAASGAIAAGALVVSAAAGAVATIGAGTFDQVVGITESAAASNLVRVRTFR